MQKVKPVKSHNKTDIKDAEFQKLMVLEIH